MLPFLLSAGVVCCIFTRMGMTIEKYLSTEWVPALGCTEPVSIAYAIMTAAARLDETPEKVLLKTDPRIYKNCYAVGIPNSGHRTGILWAAAIGAFLNRVDAGLQCFEFLTPVAILAAGRLIRTGAVTILVDRSKKELFIDATVAGRKNKARCVIENTHTNVTLALKGIGIPSQDGIVGRNGTESLRNMGSIATRGMEKTDDEILGIMEKKLRKSSQI